MRINFNRLSKLAGLPEDHSSRRSLNEGKHQEEEVAEMEEMEEGASCGMDEEDDMSEMADIAFMNEEDDEDDMDEMIEIDEVMLVQELRRAKRIMQENKRRKQLAESKRRERKQKMFEAQLRQVIDEEVQNVFDEMQISGQWVYGSKKPTRSKKGYTHQGSFLPGFGFKR